MESARTGQIRGYLCVVAAAITWASSGTMGKALFEGGMSPFELVQARVTVSLLLLGAWMAVLSPRHLRVRLRDIGYFVILGGVFLAVNNIAYFYAISRIQVAAAILLQYLSPILVAIFAMLFWKERATTLKVAVLILAFGGCYLVVGGYSLELLQMNREGVLAGLVGAVCFAGYTLLGERTMHRYPPWTALLYALLFATLVWHLLETPFRFLEGGFTLQQWGGVAYVAVMGTIVPFGLYLVGVNHIRATRAIITATLEPISAGFMSFLLLGETLEPPQILGGALVIGAIVLLQLQREQDVLAPAAIRRGSAS